MKPIPRYDFPVNIQHYVWEVDEKLAQFYQGIYEVILNFHVGVVFVPEIDRTSTYWSSLILDNEDDIHSQLEARTITLARESYSVTPNSLLAGKEELISPLASDLEAGVVFYVSHQEFEVFSQELTLLDQEIGRVYNSRKISELKKFEFAKFILSRVMISKHFRQFDLKLLGG